MLTASSSLLLDDPRVALSFVGCLMASSQVCVSASSEAGVFAPSRAGISASSEVWSASPKENVLHDTGIPDTFVSLLISWRSLFVSVIPCCMTERMLRRERSESEDSPEARSSWVFSASIWKEIND